MANYDQEPRKGSEGDGRIAERLTSALAAIAGPGEDPEHRRDELVDRAEAHGIRRVTAERAYDIAREEHIEPGYGLAVVAEGISVRILDGARPDVETSEPSEPEWVDAPPDREDAERERRLRQTFRRLRTHLDNAPTATAGFQGFAHEPDLEAFDY